NDTADFTAGGHPLAVERKAAGSSGQPVQAFTYDYQGDAQGSQDRLATVKMWVNGAVARQVEYAYYAGGSTEGSSGDLKSATVKDAAGTVVGQNHYTYEKTFENFSGGASAPHRMLAAFDSAAIARMKGDGIIDPVQWPTAYA